jgi:hypothetical protein
MYLVRRLDGETAAVRGFHPIGSPRHEFTLAEECGVQAAGLLGHSCQEKTGIPVLFPRCVRHLPQSHVVSHVDGHIQRNAGV